MARFPFDFSIAATSGAARAGTFRTPHGLVETPAFMPVGTRATVKGLTNTQLDAIRPEVVLANTYHLHLRPGEALIRELGGLHAFTGWDRPLLTDSGGFQVFSLGALVAIDEQGVTVKSHLDGSPVRLGPTEAVAIQEALGADVAMAFDQCCRLPASRDAVAAAVDRTSRWARACLDARTRDDQAIFGIVQGGVDHELRARSAGELTSMEFEGFAIGGLSVGEGPDALRSTLAFTAPRLPADRPRYLMGVGLPLDLLDGVTLGIDLFDCVVGTRNGRRGHLFTRDGVVRIGRDEYRDDESALDPDCRCEVCRRHSRAYLHHLFAIGEFTATVLGSLHNTTFLVDWVRSLRAALVTGTFATTSGAMRARYVCGEARYAELYAADPEGRIASRAAAAALASRRSPRPQEDQE